MQTSIEAGDDEGCGLEVTDNNRSRHWIEIKYDSKDISYHECDEYENNPVLRTREDGEHVDQARRYARWYVYREQGYDTVPPTENPDRLMAGLLGIAMLSDAEFDEYFGDLEERLERHYDNAPVNLPFPDADPDDAIIYQKDVYLEPNPVEFEPPVLEQFLGRFEGEPDSPALDDGDIPLEEMDDLKFEIEAVSEIHTLHNDGQGTEQIDHGEQPLDREPDVRVELMAFDPASVDSFQHYVVSHLAYQIRDRFLLMGVKPPVPFRAQGWGTYEGFQCQKFCSLYDEYWSSEATITSWDPS